MSAEIEPLFGDIVETHHSEEPPASQSEMLGNLFGADESVKPEPKKPEKVVVVMNDGHVQEACN
jgi:hypothetical protein